MVSTHHKKDRISYLMVALAILFYGKEKLQCNVLLGEAME
jgi:hypothetical protein